MLLALTGYDVGKFIHVLAVVVGLGPTFAYAVLMPFADKFAQASVPTVYRAAQKIDRFLVTPGLIIVLLAGIYMLADAHIKVSEGYVSVGFLAVIVLLGMTHGFFAPRYRRGIELAEHDLAGGGELGADYQALSRQLAIGGQIAGLVIAVTIFFMVVKP